jgi:ATP-dependent Clp protease ATP-binding subunit ClpA
MSCDVRDNIADRIIDDVADFSSQQVFQELKDRGIVLHYSEVPRDVLVEVLYEEKMGFYI